MSTSPLLPQIPGWVSDLCSVPAVMAISSSVEGFFYANVDGVSEKTPKAVKWIRGNCVAHIHKIQMVFNFINTSFIFYNAHNLVKEIYTPMAENTGFIYFASLASGIPLKNVDFYLIVALVVGGAFSCAFIMNGLNKEKSISITNGALGISNKPRLAQTISKYVLTTKLVLDIASFIFKDNKIAFTLGMIASGYNLLKNSQIEWYNYSRAYYHIANGFQDNMILFTYNMLQLNALNHVETGKQCCLCCSENTNQLYCINHSLHSQCIEKFIKSKGDEFGNFEDIRRLETPHYNQHGHYTYKSYAYEIRMKESIVPFCPECNINPLQNHFEVKYSDKQLNKTFDANITFTDPKKRDKSEQPFDRLYAAYNIVQAGLTYLQNYPELAGTLYKVQEFMIVLDCVGLYISCGSLLEKIKKKYAVDKSNSKRFYKIALVSGGAFTALSCLAVWKLNSFLASSIDLNDVISKMNLPRNFLKDLDVQWASPWSKYLMQTVLIHRIAVNLGLACFLENRDANLISAAAQSATLFKISNLRWINLNQVVRDAQVSPLSIQSMFMVDPACAKDKSYLQDSLNVIHRYLSTLLKDSRFESWSLDHYTNYVFTHREYFWKAFLKNPVLAPYEPYLRNLSMNVLSDRVEVIM